MATGGEGPSTAVSDDQFTQLMAAIHASQERIDYKFAEFRAEMKQGQEDAAAKALKRVRHDKPYAFRRKASTRRWRRSSRKPRPSYPTSGVRPHSSERRNPWPKAERQKLIKIADRSEYGWGVVTEYTADELADGSDDEKRLEKAEKAAERKALKRKRKRVEPSPKPARSRFNSGQVPPLLATTPSAVAAKRPAGLPSLAWPDSRRKSESLVHCPYRTRSDTHPSWGGR